MCGGNADGHTDRHTNHASRYDQCQAFGGFLPVSLIDDKQEPQRYKQAGFPIALQGVGKGNETGDGDQRVRGLQHPQDGVDHHFHHPRQPVKERLAFVLEPVKDAFGKFPDGDFGFS